MFGQPNLNIGLREVPQMSKKSEQMAYLELVKTRCEALLYAQKFGLSAAHAHLSISNISAKVPYHNNDHILTVTKWCGRLAGMHSAPLESEKALILAAMFHDVDHTGGHEPDSVNVAAAIDAMNKFLDIHKLLTSEEREIAVACVQCTQFPFTIDPTLEVQKIIRDADILQGIEADFERIMLGGLREEISISRGKQVTRKEFAQGNLAFLDGVQMYTTAGAVLLAAAKPIVCNTYNRLAGNYYAN